MTDVSPHPDMARLREILRHVAGCGGPDPDIAAIHDCAVQYADWCDACADLLLRALLDAAQLNAAQVEAETMERCLKASRGPGGEDTFASRRIAVLPLVWSPKDETPKESAE